MTGNETLARLIRNEPYIIGQLAGFKDLREINNDWIKSFLFCESDQTILAHRGSYKTSCLIVTVALNMILRPNQNILLFRKTDTDVGEVVNAIRKMLETELMHDICRKLHDRDYHFTRTSMSELNTSLQSGAKGASQLLGAGIKTSITGKHADIVITDDIVNLSDRISASERLRTKLAYMELQNVKNRGGRFINTGTPWHKEDAIALMPNIDRFDYRRTGMISKEQVAKLRSDMSPSLFAANYELKHIADENALFVNPNFTEDASLLYEGIAHIDAAYGGGDSTAFTICKKGADGKYYLFGKRYQRHVDDCLDSILSLHDAYKAGTIYLELNADKGYLAKEIRKRGIPVKTYHEKMNKYIKIASYLKKAWRDIWIIEDTDAEYVQEILDYNENAVHDDCPDSAASIIRETGKGDGKVKIKAFAGGI